MVVILDFCRVVVIINVVNIVNVIIIIIINIWIIIIVYGNNKKIVRKIYKEICYKLNY